MMILEGLHLPHGLFMERRHDEGRRSCWEDLPVCPFLDKPLRLGLSFLASHSTPDILPAYLPWPGLVGPQAFLLPRALRPSVLTRLGQVVHSEPPDVTSVQDLLT